MFERRGTFEAYDDGGLPHRVFVYLRVPSPPATLEQRAAQDGLRLLTSQNEAVRRLGKGEYVTLFGKHLVSSDPLAP